MIDRRRGLVPMLMAATLTLAACGTGSPATTSPTIGPTVAPSPAHASAAPTASQKPLNLLILGDSIAIPKMGCGSCEGFDAQYAGFLEEETGRPVRLTNEARPNAQIRDLQSVLDTEVAVQQEVAAADIVVVSIGYNNTPPWGPELPCPAPPVNQDADLWPAILAMTPDCIDASIGIFGLELAAVYGRIEALAGGRDQIRITLGVFNNLRDNPGGDGTLGNVEPSVLAAAAKIYQSAMEKWNAADCTAAKAHGFVCGDLYHAFNGPDGTGSIKALVNPDDFVHPNIAGQAVMAALLKGLDIAVTVQG